MSLYYHKSAEISSLVSRAERGYAGFEVVFIMADGLDLELALIGAAGACDEAALARCNGISSRFGLALTRGELEALASARREALKNSGRVELEGGVLPSLIYAFCDSPYISRGDYFKTLLELQDLFYYFKSESPDPPADGELIESMSAVFNGEAGGETDYLASLNCTELLRRARDPRGGVGDDL